MKQVIFGISLVGALGVLAFAQQQGVRSAEKGDDHHSLLSNLKVGEWISFNSGDQGITIRVMKKSQDLTIDAWHEQFVSLIRERNALMEPYQPRASRRAANDKPQPPRPADFDQQRQQAHTKADEIETKIQTFGERPYEITGVYDDHLAVRDKSTEFFLSATAIRYITRSREE